MSEFCVRLLSCAMSRLWQFEGCCVSMQAWLVTFCAIVWQLATSGALCSLATMYIACNSRSVHYASDSCFWRVICGVLWLVGMPYVRFQLWWPSKLWVLNTACAHWWCPLSHSWRSSRHTDELYNFPKSVTILYNTKHQYTHANSSEPKLIIE